MSLRIKVTKINNRWHSRLFENDNVIDEMACVKSEDIGWICREMLRWYDKMSDNSDELAKSARKRQTSKPIGQIYYSHKLKQGKQ